MPIKSQWKNQKHFSDSASFPNFASLHFYWKILNGYFLLQCVSITIQFCQHFGWDLLGGQVPLFMLALGLKWMHKLINRVRIKLFRFKKINFCRKMAACSENPISFKLFLTYFVSYIQNINAKLSVCTEKHFIRVIPVWLSDLKIN